ncbi:hypothetical protein JAAARDRAFT_134622 [Jaapia argillacea MUCL 33604]|uniref:ARM repeat-containing protein n=1 Tax=Jaapia argillacea MUCL 33604 TaxID=933084 RepID=A0A067PLS5_9AGAM|nr:hypothetical protein JAAARDRAFT_134622 [Jaapia argillacea MUCL 33604]
MTSPGSPLATESPESEDSVLEKQRASLQTYLDHLPYDGESADEMQAKLEYIVGRIVICAKAKNWLVLTTWDGKLQCWLLMRYPMPKSTRAKLVRLYYELCLLPGIEPRVLRSWADMASRLISNKPGSKRKLEATDLQLPWKPLWEALQKELWPKKRLLDTTRNVLNILLYVAEQSKRYYPAEEIPEMLDTFFPLLTKETFLTMIPVITSFLPPTHPHLYLPALFSLWEAFNSSVMDDRLLELAGDLAEEHVVGKVGLAGEEGGAEWKYVGIWTENQWTFLAGKALGSMNVPVGATRGTSTTGGHADAMADRQSLRIKKAINRYSALAKMLVYSMSLDGPVREEISTPNARSRETRLPAQQNGYLAGSRALDSLDKLITSTESFFHPSNSGTWTLCLTNFIHRLTTEFTKRWKEEELPSCKTPVTHRLTPSIRRAFVTTLRTPALLAMFSKDPISMSYAQGALRGMAMLDATLIMPELLDRAYSGLEVVNETHRTTAVLSLLSGVTLPLVSEKVWLGGQKHLVPLLELCIPGIDLNDHIKTVCATMFIVSAVQHIKIGDLSIQQTGLSFSTDAPAEDMMNIDEQSGLPNGVEGNGLVLSREDERALVRDSTASFADWVTSLFRRVLALYENLPEEGGKKGTTGGKQEESVLKSIKSMMDVVCLHLSDPLFDLVLKLMFDYGTSNAKSNSVRAFGQLIACLARVKPDQTIDRFLPHCVRQIQEELKHGASSIMTTSTHTAVASDTTLHWNLSILRGCLGYGGAALLKHKDTVKELIILLVDKTKSERGYSSVGRLITRILHTLGGVYPLNSRFINTEEWDDPMFNRDHNTQWGRLYEACDLTEHLSVPTEPEIAFILDILGTVGAPALKNIEELLESSGKWDNVSRNRFCRYMNVVRSIWSGLPTLFQEGPKQVVNPCINEETEVESLLVTPLIVKAGFTLTDPRDPRYQKVVEHRSQFGRTVHLAAITLRKQLEGEDHIDAVISVAKAIDVFLLEYGMTRGSFDSLQNNYSSARELNRVWSKQKENSRLVWLKRAQVYHTGRVYMHALHRGRSDLDDKLLSDLVELSLSPYTRVRRHSQAILHNVCGYYVRSTRMTLPALFDALVKGTDPDRMKGALYLLWNKGTAAYALADQTYHGRYLLSLLECQHQEKPSVQKLVGSLAHDCLAHLSEESVHTDSYLEDAPRIDEALLRLEEEFSSALVDRNLLAQVLQKSPARASSRNVSSQRVCSAVLEIALRSTTHWRYVQMATRFLFCLLRRDNPTTPELAKFFFENTVSPHSTIRLHAQRAVVKLATFIKARTYAKSTKELWLETWSNPLQRRVSVGDPSRFNESINCQRYTQVCQSSPKQLTHFHRNYVDKISTGFISWTPDLKGYQPAPDRTSPFIWDGDSQAALSVILLGMNDDYFSKLALLWSQESNRSGGATDVRQDNCVFIKTLAKMYEATKLDQILAVVEPLLFDSDKFKQRGAAEILLGLWRGSKHWPKQSSAKLWSWTMDRMDRIFAQIKPDTLPFWETAFSLQLVDRDPRRHQAMLDWILALPLEFHGDSAFAMNKTLSLFGIVVDCLGPRFMPLSDKYFNLLLDNANTGYAEIRAHISQNLYMIMRCQWQPSYPSTDMFLSACRTTTDPMKLRDKRYLSRVIEILDQFPKWKEERFPPPRVNQSQYDKVGLTLLQWLWASCHGPQASLIFPYILPMLPEILRMSELSDSSELQNYSSAVLYVLSAVTPPPEYINVILEHFLGAIRSSKSWRIRLNALPTLVVFFYRNLLSVSSKEVSAVMDVLLECLSDENVEVREMSSKVLSGLVRCSQRQSIIPLKNRFVALARKVQLPARKDPTYADSLRTLHSSILGLCALIESFPYSVERWMPPLTEVLALHATDPPPISTTIRKCASELIRSVDTWHKDQQAFNEDQLQDLSTMLVGTSYCEFFK